MKIEFLLAWYDLWIGFFWDSKKRWLYFLPIPCVGVVFKFQEPKTDVEKYTFKPLDKVVIVDRVSYNKGKEGVVVEIIEGADRPIAVLLPRHDYELYYTEKDIQLINPL